MIRHVCAVVGAIAMLAAAPQSGPPPRLAGLVVAPDYRAALFDGPGGGGAVQVGEGEEIGGYIVRAIGPDGVRLERAGKVTLVAPGASSRPPPADTGGVTFGVAINPQGPPDD